MKRLATASAAMLMVCACATRASEWIQMDTATRALQYWQNVEYLETPPGPDRPYTVVGIITPSGTFETEAQAIDHLRRIAAQHGADAIFLEPKTSSGDSNAQWWAPGETTDASYRAKAIAWGLTTP